MRTLLLLSLALSACVTPKILGPNPDEEGGKDTEPGDESSADDTSDTDLTTAPDATDSTSDDPGASVTGDSPTPAECDADTPEACEATPGCMTVFGAPEAFPGCSTEPQYLGCLPELPCDSILLTVCDDETDESYVLPDGCVPPGFSACPGRGTPCGEDGCAGLGPDECAAKGCTVINGAPHVVEKDATCADYDALEFLGCLPPETSCPPQVLILCPVGQVEPTWDVPSGCFVPGLEECGDAFVPACE